MKTHTFCLFVKGWCECNVFSKGNVLTMNQVDINLYVSIMKVEGGFVVYFIDPYTL